MKKAIKDILLGTDTDSIDVKVMDMENYPMGTWETFTSGIRFKKIWNDSQKLVFLCEMEKGSGYGIHVHSNADEYLTILNGIMRDNKTGRKYVRSETVGYTRGVPHAPVAVTTVLMIIAFYF